MSSPESPERPGVWLTAAALLLMTLLIAWPLPVEIGRSVAGDYGDSLFVTWAMAWVNGRLSSGQLDGFWDANIFFPERTTLAFSENFIAQTLLVLPVFAASDNPILAYNVAVALAFVLTGVATFLLTRALTGSAIGAVVAAVVASFNEYRLLTLSHLQLLSLQWWPLALYAVHRYFATDRRRWLVAAWVSFILLHLSSVYYMVYCAPLFAIFLTAELVRSGRWRVGRVWLELWALAGAVAAGVLPFLLPYFEVRQRLGVARSVAEVIQSAFQLDDYMRLLDGILPPLLLAIVAAVGAPLIRSIRSATLLTLLLMVLSFWLSLGPTVMSDGQPTGWPSLYQSLYNSFPGFDALRVPARYVSLFFLFLGIAAALGIRCVELWSRLAARVVAVAVMAIFLYFSVPATFPMNTPLTSAALVNPPPAYLTPAPSLSPIYRHIETLRPTAILIELPFGDPWYELRYMYFSAMHRRRLLNGYSGIFPPSYLRRQQVLQQPLLDPRASWEALAGATHVVVHARAWSDDTGLRVGAWLTAAGALPLDEADGATLYELPSPERLASRARRDTLRAAATSPTTVLSRRR